MANFRVDTWIKVFHVIISIILPVHDLQISLFFTFRFQKMASSGRNINASLELANLEMEAKERAKRTVANLLQVSCIYFYGFPKNFEKKNRNMHVLISKHAFDLVLT